MIIKRPCLRYISAFLPLSVASFLLLPSSALGCCGAPPEPPLNGFGDPGPHVTESLTLTDRCAVIQPTASAQSSTATYPVVLWAGGAGTTVEVYQQGLEHIASYGFVVGSLGSAPNGIQEGEALLSCLDTITGDSSVRADVSRSAAVGHSTGGSAAVFAGTDSRVDTTVVIQPLISQGTGHEAAWNSEQQGPMLLPLGELDTLVNIDRYIEPFFNSVNTPVFSSLLADADHFEPLGDFGGFSPVIAGWLRYQLYDDALAAELFVLPERLVCGEPNFGCEIKGDFQ